MPKNKTVRVEVRIRTFHTSPDGFDVTPSACFVIDRTRFDDVSTTPDIAKICDELDSTLDDFEAEIGSAVQPMTAEEVVEFRASEKEDDEGLVTLKL